MKSFVLIALFAIASTEGKKLNAVSESDELPYGDYFKGDYHGFPGTKGYAPDYERKVPDHFQDKHVDDMFMNSMIGTYAKEGKNPDGKPNGKFYLDRESGLRASQEVVNTHLKLQG